MSKPTTIHALGLAQDAFNGKTDLAGKPYIDHLKRVADNFIKANGFDEELVQIAILHDLFEDCPEYTPEKLKELGYSDPVIAGIELLTRHKHENYQKYIERIAKDKYIKQVKLADLTDNMDLTRLNQITQLDVERIKKYHAAYIFLLNN
jgi:(p)ppGpp synthase/HD superfamily hydrolase